MKVSFPYFSHTVDLSGAVLKAISSKYSIVAITAFNEESILKTASSIVYVRIMFSVQRTRHHFHQIIYWTVSMFLKEGLWLQSISSHCPGLINRNSGEHADRMLWISAPRINSPTCSEFLTYDEDFFDISIRNLLSGLACWIHVTYYWPPRNINWILRKRYICDSLV